MAFTVTAQRTKQDVGYGNRLAAGINVSQLNLNPVMEQVSLWAKRKQADQHPESTLNMTTMALACGLRDETASALIKRRSDTKRPMMPKAAQSGQNRSDLSLPLMALVTHLSIKHGGRFGNVIQ